MTNDDQKYRALLARDPRFDGKFYVGVKTTGIYCRPVCPAQPKRENVVFFSSAPLAEKAGFRPCLRCRPESAPGSPAWMGKSAVVQRALRLLAHPDGDTLSEDQFAERLGVSARHLRRLFEEELGQTPKQIADANRLNFARKLVVETTLPIADVAFVAGFQSLRRFNDAFVKRFHRAPSETRSRKTTAGPPGFHELSLAFRPPLAWDSIYDFHRSHVMHGLERIEDGVYERIFRFEKSVGVCRVSLPDSAKPALRLSVLTDNPRALLPVTKKIRRMFDLDSDPLLVANHFGENAFLAGLVEKYPGLRLPRGWDPFETAIAIILGQLVSIAQGVRMLGQLIAHYGEEVVHPITGGKAYFFPTAAVLAQADLAAVGTTGARKRTIQNLARIVVAHPNALSDTQDLEAVRALLLAVPGIGPWSAEYICLRALGDTDAFPGSDLILKRALEKHPDLDPASVRPWKSYLAIYLWKEYAAALSKAKKGTAHAVL